MCLEGYETYECGHERVAFRDCQTNVERMENGGELGLQHSCPGYRYTGDRFGEAGEAGPRCIECEKIHAHERKKPRQEGNKLRKIFSRQSKADVN